MMNTDTSILNQCILKKIIEYLDSLNQLKFQIVSKSFHKITNQIGQEKVKLLTPQYIIYTEDFLALKYLSYYRIIVYFDIEKFYGIVCSIDKRIVKYILSRISRENTIHYKNINDKVYKNYYDYISETSIQSININNDYYKLYYKSCLAITVIFKNYNLFNKISDYHFKNRIPKNILNMFPEAVLLNNIDSYFIGWDVLELIISYSDFQTKINFLTVSKKIKNMVKLKKYDKKSVWELVEMENYAKLLEIHPELYSDTMSLYGLVFNADKILIKKILTRIIYSSKKVHIKSIYIECYNFICGNINFHHILNLFRDEWRNNIFLALSIVFEQRDILNILLKNKHTEYVKNMLISIARKNNCSYKIIKLLDPNYSNFIGWNAIELIISYLSFKTKIKLLTISKQLYKLINKTFTEKQHYKLFSIKHTKSIYTLFELYNIIYTKKKGLIRFIFNKIKLNDVKYTIFYKCVTGEFEFNHDIKFINNPMYRNICLSLCVVFRHEHLVKKIIELCPFMNIPKNIGYLAKLHDSCKFLTYKTIN